MEKFENLLENVLAMHMQAEHYSEIWDMLLKNRSVSKALIHAAATEEELIAFLEHYGPKQADEVLDDDFLSVCQDLLPLAYHEKHWCKLIGWIYGTGLNILYDSLCMNRHPLVFAAQQHDLPLAEAYISGQKHFDYLTFDGERQCEDGAFRTVLEEIVLADDVHIMALCLQNGACANAFCFQGDKLTDLARSCRMRRLLGKFGGKRATRKERNLVRAANEIRQKCLQESTVKALFRTNPLRKLFASGRSAEEIQLKLSWRNGTTKNSQEQNIDLFLAAATACYADLLAALYPYAEKTLDDQQRKHILKAILGQHQTLPFGNQVLEERPIDVVHTLNALCHAGFRYPTASDPANPHPILDIIHCACWALSLCGVKSLNIQSRIFFALWAIGGEPVSQDAAQTLDGFMQDHSLVGLELLCISVHSKLQED